MCYEDWRPKLEAQLADSGGGILGEGQLASSGSTVSSLSGVRGRSPDRQVVLCILSTPDAIS